MRPAGGLSGNAPAWNEEAQHVTRWLQIRFPHAQSRDRERVVRSLARRGDAAAAVVLLSFLWHMEDPDRFGVNEMVERNVQQRVEQAALEAVTGLGAAAFPAAHRFLKEADTPLRRRRGVAALRGIGDKRAVGVLLDVLATDEHAQQSLGTAGALEALGDERAIGALVEAALEPGRPFPRRSEAIEALAVFKDPRAIEAVSHLAKEDGFATVSAYALFRLTGDKAALARLVNMAKAGENGAELLRLCSKCESPRTKAVFLNILRVADDPADREKTLRVIKKRFGDDARDEITRIFLEEAASPGAPEFVIRELGEMGTPEAVERLLAIVKGGKTDAERWAAACRSLARTGDEKAVRYFSRQRILEKDPGKRRLADQLYAEAAKRQAQLRRAKSG
jgi:HEAT repeat protein